MIRSSNASASEALVAKHPGLVGVDEARRIKAEAKIAALDEQVLREAQKRLAAQREPPNKMHFLFAGMLMGGVGHERPASTDSRLVLGALASRLHRGCEQAGPQVGAIAHVASWSAAYATTFIILGVFPAEIIAPMAQGWIILGSATLVWSHRGLV